MVALPLNYPRNYPANTPGYLKFSRLPEFLIEGIELTLAAFYTKIKHGNKNRNSTNLTDFSLSWDYSQNDFYINGKNAKHFHNLPHNKHLQWLIEWKKLIL
ncbi:hypothetical protein SAMN04488084_103106 [Pedobacter antarcticus]|nr:hypothetical protein SAMN04488084_103106 [Pedobacter antarcticus]